MERPIEIAVVSGKGGTGKTLVAKMLAHLSQSSVLVDCDLDAPGLHLLAGPLAVERGPVAGDQIAIIDEGRCSRCGECLKACRFGAVRERDVPEGWCYTVMSRLCEGCGACAATCPDDAIRLLELPGGTWCVSGSPLGPVVYASLQGPSRNGAGIIRVLRREARKAAAREGLRMVVIDGPAGIGATVMASLVGAALAVVVAEPTISGVYDLRRMIDLLGRIGIGTAGIINRADLNPDLATDIARCMKDRDVKLLGSVAYSDAIARADCAGEFPVDLPEEAAADQLRVVAGLVLEAAAEA